MLLPLSACDISVGTKEALDLCCRNVNALPVCLGDARGNPEGSPYDRDVPNRQIDDVGASG